MLILIFLITTYSTLYSVISLIISIFFVLRNSYDLIAFQQHYFYKNIHIIKYYELLNFIWDNKNKYLMILYKLSLSYKNINHNVILLFMTRYHHQSTNNISNKLYLVLNFKLLSIISNLISKLKIFSLYSNNSSKLFCC